MDADERKRLDRITERIIGSAYEVANTLGIGFLERVYENALAHELLKQGSAVRQQMPIRVHYDGVVVGDYIADLVLEESVLVELKVAKSLDDAHVAQCLNYLKATAHRVCLLINFGTSRIEIKRIVNQF